MKLKSRIVASIAFSLWAVACGGVTNPNLGVGMTTCGSVTCNPGQYCYGQGACTSGCESNVNCASGETCQKASGFETGSCVGGSVTTTVSRDDFCTKAKACDPSLSESACTQLFNGAGETCKKCLMAESCSTLANCNSTCGTHF